MPVIYRWATVVAEGAAWLDSGRSLKGGLARACGMLVSARSRPASSQEGDEVTLEFHSAQARVVPGRGADEPGETEGITVWLMLCPVSCAATMPSEAPGGGGDGFVVGVDARQIHLSPEFPTSLIGVDGEAQCLESRVSTNALLDEDKQASCYTQSHHQAVNH